MADSSHGAGDPLRGRSAGRLGLGCIVALLALIVGSVAGYGVLALPILSGGDQAAAAAIVAVCAVLAVALSSMAFLLFARSAPHS